MEAEEDQVVAEVERMTMIFKLGWIVYGDSMAGCSMADRDDVLLVRS